MTDATRAGIAAYDHEQKLFKRLLRKRGEFTASEFDEWMWRREYRRPTMARFYDPETFILGFSDGMKSRWGEMLELLQIMAQLGDIQITRRGDEIVYFKD